ncbi:hypothetical protein [Turneriella parva]|uniref:Uncharacterized protein n=1 Tax=Turneriella parva (strain ATCC BAA-1111 / DSM 21527 / NCTC 11395 / H) TaxID=869212 RepID=I4B8S8_TURPD|nr:hypothetical protein [Turneriella parva]AFM13685.1 hypothetical protein Turpa_3046 [Turneriella parva DSM 21527]
MNLRTSSVIIVLCLAFTRCGSLLSELDRIKKKFEGTPAAPQVGEVQPVYAAATNWLQYVRNDGTGALTATGTLCDGAETGLASSCLHGGEMKRVPVTNRSDCAGLNATDALGAFTWRCAMINGVPNMVTGGLAEERYLSHLLDFSGTGSWRLNSVTVTDSAGSASTEPTLWYTNPIVRDFTDVASPSSLDLNNSDTVYMFTTSPGKQLFLSGARAALVTQPGVVIATTAVLHHISPSNSFNWVEATTDSTGATNSALNLTNSNFCAVRGSNFANRRIVFASTNYARVSFTRVFNAGIDFVGSGVGNIFNEVILSNGRWLLDAAGNHNLVSVGLTLHNADYGYSTGNSQTYTGHIGINHTGANLAVQGLRGGPIEDSTFMNMLYVNNESFGIGTAGVRNTFVNVAIGSAQARISSTANFEYFSGQVRYGQTNALCAVGAGTHGIDASCIAQNASDFTLTTSLNFNAAFVGRVTADDTANQSDAAGLATFGSIADYFRFESRHRGYGREAAIAHFDTTHRGACTSGSCRIWDLRLRSTDTQLREVLPVPGTDDMYFHHWQAGTADACTAIHGAVWGDAVCSLPGYTDQGACEGEGGAWQASICTTRALRNAYEILNDARGNDNGLCESNEACMYTPNFGAYQGHGRIVSVGNISGGDFLNVDLYRFETNGI